MERASDAREMKKLADIQAKLDKEYKVLDAAQRMMQVSSDQGMCKTNIHEVLARINYLEGEMRKITGSSEGNFNELLSTNDKPMPILKDTRTTRLGGLLEKLVFKGSKDSLTSPDPSLNIASDSMEFLIYGNTLTSEQLIYRLAHIGKKIEVEKRVKSGTENLLMALKGKKEAVDLALKVEESNSKIQLLSKSNSKYADLNMSDVREEDESLLDSKDRKTGRIKFKLVGAANLASRKSQKDEIQAKIKVDGCLIYSSRLAKMKWDENVDLQVDRAGEIEILVVDKAGNILSFIWFHLSDLTRFLDNKYGVERAGVDMEESWIDLEPSGQLCLKMNFEQLKKTKGSQNELFRREAVVKIYPKNGHQFVAQQFYQVMKCAVCSEFLGRGSYHCQTCNYLIHARCYKRVITKCVDCHNPNYPAMSKEQQNTGQLLKYNIPHRWSVGTNLIANWCSHCGGIIPPTRKVHRCTECNKVSHNECSPMIPSFCGLTPAVADQLVAAFEAHEKKLHKNELEEAENERKMRTNEEEDLGPDRAFTLGKDYLKKVLSDRDVTPAVAPNINNLSSGIILEDFSLHAVLGRGAFGKVLLVSELKTGAYFALKALKKDFIVKNDDVERLDLVEYNLNNSRHPFLVNLHSCFHSPTRIFFVMEYVPGGDLMTHIQEVRRFSQLRTKFYACEVLLALEYLHMNKVIYRDLKLDNILLCSDGHIKVADYGICKDNISYGDFTSTFCGTPDYMAVEVLLNKKYGLAVDWWSFGILIYVMLIGKYPFHGEDENQILEAILSDSIDFPPNMPKTTLSLIQSLLNKNPARRLGGGAEDANEVRRHPYFAGVDWNALFSKTLTPPFIPTIGYVEDVSNFDRTFTTEEPVLTPLNSTLGAVEQGEFNDFAFVSDWAIKSRIAST